MHYAMKQAHGITMYALSAAYPLGGYGFSMKESVKRIAKRMNDATNVQFEVGNVVRTQWGQTRVVEEQRGQYVRYMDNGRKRWASAAIYHVVAVDMRQFEFDQRIQQLEFERDKAIANAESKFRQEQIELSKNTITRALVHASSNGYCSETAVALISAGHRLPDVTLDLEVKLRLSLTLEGNKSYYPLRDLFGATQGKVDGAQGIDVNSDKLYDKLAEVLGADKYDYISDVRLRNTTVDWKAPAIRMLSTNEAVQEFETEQDNDDD